MPVITCTRCGEQVTYSRSTTVDVVCPHPGCGTVLIRARQTDSVSSSGRRRTTREVVSSPHIHTSFGSVHGPSMGYWEERNTGPMFITPYGIRPGAINMTHVLPSPPVMPTMMHPVMRSPMVTITTSESVSEDNTPTVSLWNIWS